MRRKQLTVAQKVFIVKKYYQISDMFEVRTSFSRSYSIKTTEKIVESFFNIVTQFELTGSVTQNVFYDTFEEEPKDKEEEDDETPTSPKRRGRKPREKKKERIILKVPESEDDEGQVEVEQPVVMQTVNLDTKTEPPMQWNLDLGNGQQGGNIIITVATTPEIVPEEQLFEIGEIIHHKGLLGDPEEVQAEAQDDEDYEEEPIAEGNDASDSEEDSDEVEEPKEKKKKKQVVKLAKGSLHKPRLECIVCQKTYTKVFFRSHMLKHDREGYTYECKLCDQTFVKYEGLRIHEEEHIPVTKYGFKCGTCAQKFVSEEKLLLHQKTHAEPKTFICEWCAATFTKSDSLRVHIRTHTGEKPLKCRECNESFAFYGALKAHMKKHEGGTYKCNYCDKAFVYKVERNVSGRTRRPSNIFLKHLSKPSFPAPPQRTHRTQTVHLPRL